MLRRCPKGHYCPEGTALPTQYPCPMGTFNPRQATHSPSDCMPCAAGHHCPSVGLAEPAGEKREFNFFNVLQQHIQQQLCISSTCDCKWTVSNYSIWLGCLSCRTMPCRLLVQRWGVLSNPCGWILRLTVSSWSLLPSRFQWTQRHSLYHHQSKHEAVMQVS